MRISDWSSDVCSSDLRLADALQDLHEVRRRIAAHGGVADLAPPPRRLAVVVPVPAGHLQPRVDRQSVVQGKSVAVRVDLGGRRLIQKNIKPQRAYSMLTSNTGQVSTKFNQIQG